MGMMIVFAAGMAAAFLLGAHVRMPFTGAVRREKEVRAAPAEEEAAGGRLTVEQQLENMLNYNGESQDG